MTKYRGLLATTNQVGGDRLSEECLEKMAKGCFNVPVVLNFSYGKPVGRITSGNLTEQGVEVEFQMVSGVFVAEESYIVPGIRVIEMHEDGDVRVIDECKLFEASLTFHPSNTNLTPVKKVD